MLEAFSSGSRLKTTSEWPQSGPVTPLSLNEWFLSNQNKQGGTAIRMIVPFCQVWQRGFFMFKKHGQKGEL